MFSFSFQYTAVLQEIHAGTTRKTVPLSANWALLDGITQLVEQKVKRRTTYSLNAAERRSLVLDALDIMAHQLRPQWIRVFRSGFALSLLRNVRGKEKND